MAFAQVKRRLTMDIVWPRIRVATVAKRRVRVLRVISVRVIQVVGNSDILRAAIVVLLLLLLTKALTQRSIFQRHFAWLQYCL